MRTRKSFFCTGLAIAMLSAGALCAAEPTALDLIKEGNRYVGEDSKNKVVQIRSEKSVAGMTPNIWYVVYYDPDATFKATEVKFGAGKKLDVKRPMRMVERVTGESAFDLDKLKIDSPKALKIAQSQELLDKIKLTNSQMWLERREGEPTWRVRLWAEKLRKPDQTVDIGEVFISAETGKVTREDLHIQRVD